MKNHKFLLVLFVPVALLAFKLSAIGLQSDDGEQLQCSQYGTVEVNYNGNQGCPYAFDFNSLVNSSCVLEDIDLDRNTPGIQHYAEGFTSITWTNGDDGIIHMQPKSGYGGQGFTVSNDVILDFTNNTTESPTWTMYVNYYGGPYPAPVINNLPTCQM